MSIFKEVISNMDANEVAAVSAILYELSSEGVMEQAAPQSDDIRLVRVGTFMERVSEKAVCLYGFEAVVEEIVEAPVEKIFDVEKAERDGWAEHWPNTLKINKEVMARIMKKNIHSWVEKAAQDK